LNTYDQRLNDFVPGDRIDILRAVIFVYEIRGVGVVSEVVGAGVPGCV
jgi:hypothetical protein